MTRSLAIFAVVLAPGLVRADEPPALSRRERGDLAIHARAILRQHCYACHGGEKNCSTLPILEHPKLIATTNPVPFVAPTKVTGSQIVQFIEDGSMPPGDRPRLESKEIDVLKKWIAVGAPSFPVAFDDAGTLRAMLDDIATHQDDAANLRYFSFAHLVTDKGPPPDLVKADGDLKRALFRFGITTPPVPVDDSATLFRFDIRTAGWDKRDLFEKAGGIYPINTYDVLLLEYPFGVAVSGNKRLDDYFATAKLVRPIPFLRADWISQALVNAKNESSPLAADLLSLTDLSAALQKEGRPGIGEEARMPYGPKARPFGGQSSVPAALKPDARTPILPFDAWYSGDVHADPPPFSVIAELVDMKRASLKSVTTETPFQLKVTAKKKMRYVLLLVQADGTIRVQPTNKDGLFDADEIFLTPAGSASFKIASITSGAPTANEYFVLFAAEMDEPLPLATIIRSRHATNPNPKEVREPLQRFLFPQEKTKQFDPSKVVRKVIPIPVTSG
ncbi:MAG: hypothetical protein K8U57_37325 [Planctomycetes bacterium]|nr:hypothetical protein [Planctomycetota bacterium]